MKKHLALILALIITLSATAQTDSLRNNFLGFNFGGGLGSAMFSPCNGSGTLSFGNLMELQYQHFVSPHWGIGVGLEANYYQSKATYNFLESSEMLIHPENNWLYESRTVYDNWTERHRILSAGIPLYVIYRTPLSDKWMFKTNLGIRADYMAQSEFEVTDGTYETRGYFPKIDGELRNLPEHGFTVTEAGATGDLNLQKINVSAMANVGVEYAITPCVNLYLGIYASYGVTSIYTTNDNNLFTAASGSSAEPTYNGTFRSSQIDNAHTITAGLKFGLDFGLAQREEIEEEKELLTYEEEEEAEAEPQSKDKLPTSIITTAEEYAKAAYIYAQDKNNPEADEAAADARTEADNVKRYVNNEDIYNAEKALERAHEAFERARRAAKLGGAYIDLDQINNRQAYMRLQQMFLTLNTTIYFNTGSAVMIPDKQTMQNLQLVAEELRQWPEVELTIQGHTDNTGSVAHNVVLGMERAKCLSSILCRMGARSSQLHLVTKGQNEPAATNDTAEGRALNRRAEISVN